MTLLNMTTGHRVHDKSERKSDLYETPYVGTRSLFYGMGIFNKHGLPPKRVWEPCAGPGAMVAELRQPGIGIDVVATELLRFRRKTEPGIRFGVDFLAQASPPAGVDVIVTNPPFMYADEFLLHALDLVPVVYMLLRVGFIGSERWNNERKGEMRQHIDRMMIFAPRLPMMHRDGWKGPRNDNPAIDFAWYRFERGINLSGRSPTITWFDWRTVASEAELDQIRAQRRKSAAAAKKRKLVAAREANRAVGGAEYLT